jgi:ABC-type polysaccharide transport system permease subunit
MDLKTLQTQKDKEIHGFFYLGLQIAFIFGLPATLAIILSGALKPDSNNTTTTLALLASFVSSWIVIIYIYIKKSKKMKIIEDEIKKMKQSK